MSALMKIKIFMSVNEMLTELIQQNWKGYNSISDLRFRCVIHSKILQYESFGIFR